MKLIFLILLLSISCSKEVPSTSSEIKSSSIEASSSEKEDFSDLEKKDDEYCEDASVEEIIKKKSEEKTIKLQGGSEEDCNIE